MSKNVDFLCIWLTNTRSVSRHAKFVVPYKRGFQGGRDFIKVVSCCYISSVVIILHEIPEFGMK